MPRHTTSPSPRAEECAEKECDKASNLKEIYVGADPVLEQ